MEETTKNVGEIPQEDLKVNTPIEKEGVTSEKSSKDLGDVNLKNVDPNLFSYEEGAVWEVPAELMLSFLRFTTLVEQENNFFVTNKVANIDISKDFSTMRTPTGVTALSHMQAITSLHMTNIKKGLAKHVSELEPTKDVETTSHSENIDDDADNPVDEGGLERRPLTPQQGFDAKEEELDNRG